MTAWTARCACGQLSVACDGDPARVSLCHCLECQRRTGSTYGIAAFWPVAAVGIAGESRMFSRQGDSGFAVAFHFCSGCGTSVFWYPARRPDLVAVAVGCFADPGFPAPEQQVYLQHRHPWVPGPP